ncbi:hypothetical protein A2125_02770 [Candidatus Woesebacteria bacterium GWB1_43_5]|uniref:Thymidine kinase n=1 Tax=Candidatus Woesebacteria bacterium GWB1_43_5 TaxID=1802474 RepID=A0A1F7WTI5_9BACT|nr:MAG: hypothetical protein A2125_02770 [Candidatus Woesebacteria bacterium GWB1_43_5]
MFSEKTTTVVGLIHRAEHAGKKVQAFKPLLDDRWGTQNIKSHNGIEYKATTVKIPSEIIANLETDTDFVAIDEVQFFDTNIIEVVRYLTESNIEVVFAGLPLDFKGEPFGSMPELLAMADEVVNLTAVCKHISKDGRQCNRDATRTQRIVNGQPANYEDPIVFIGADESYTARCVEHHIVPDRPKPKIIYQASE